MEDNSTDHDLNDVVHEKNVFQLQRFPIFHQMWPQFCAKNQVRGQNDNKRKWIVH